MGFHNNFTTDISEPLYSSNVKVTYESTNTVNYIEQTLKHNDRCTGLDYMEETMSKLALHGWNQIDFTQSFHLISVAHVLRNLHRAHLLRLQHCQEDPLFCPVSQQVHHVRDTHVHGVCTSINFISLRDASVDFGVPNFWQLFRTQIEDDSAHEASGPVLRYDQNVLINIIFIKLHNGLLYYCQPCHCATSVERLGLDCKVQYTTANQEIMSQSHNSRIQYMENNLDNTFQGQVILVSVI